MNGQELTTAQVAERLGVSAVTARLWCRRGLFPNAYEQQTPRGAVWMIPESDLKGFESPKKTGRPRKEQTEQAAKKASKKKGGRK
jgi:predicted site-specific integrase-resolvase